MTNEEAIERFRVAVTATLNEEEQDLYRTAIKTLEKQIPEKPIEIESYIIFSFDYVCSCCKARLITKLDGEWVAGNKSRYCHACGQALDWSRTE